MRVIFRDGPKSAAVGAVAKSVRQLLAVRKAKNADRRVPNGPPLLRAADGRAVEILDRGLMIGRDRDSDLVVSGMHVSRRHGIVRPSTTGYVLTDVSRNGTYVNGRRVTGVQLLRNGDVIRIGQEEFHFEALRATRESAAPLPQRLVERLADLRTTERLVGISRHLATLCGLYMNRSIAMSGAIAQSAYVSISGLRRRARSRPNPDEA